MQSVAVDFINKIRVKEYEMENVVKTKIEDQVYIEGIKSEKATLLFEEFLKIENSKQKNI